MLIIIILRWEGEAQHKHGLSAEAKKLATGKKEEAKKKRMKEEEGGGDLLYLYTQNTHTHTKSTKATKLYIKMCPIVGSSEQF